MIDPVPQLRDAHVPLALGDAEVGQGAGDLGSRRAREARRRAALGRGNGGGHGGGFYHAGRGLSNAELSHGPRGCARSRQERVFGDRVGADPRARRSSLFFAEQGIEFPVSAQMSLFPPEQRIRMQRVGIMDDY